MLVVALLKSISSREISSVAVPQGSCVCITVSNTKEVWPEGVRLAFARQNRLPALIIRSLRVKLDGSANLFCWVPRGTVSMQLVSAGGLPYGGDNLSIVKVRRVGLIELGIRVGLNTPKKLVSVCKLVLKGNQKGKAFRFARAVDELNSLPYREWLVLHQRAVESAPPPMERADASILVTIDAGSSAQVIKTVESLKRQSRTGWKLIERATLDQFRFSQEKYLWLNLPAGGVLANNAIEQMLQPFTSSHVAVVYSDEDRVDFQGRRHSPILKPAWSPLLASSHWLPLDGALIKLSAVPPEVDVTSASAADAISSIAASSSEGILHLPRILLSRTDHRTTRRPRATKPSGFHSGAPMVSVIIPTRDRLELIAACVDGLRKRTTGVELDIIIVDNDSSDERAVMYLRELEREKTARVLQLPGPFNFSRACNLGVEAAAHELILLLNNDVYPITPDWLVQMRCELVDPSVGAVGAYLLYPDGLVQHAGVTLGAGSVARHSFAFIDPAGGEDRGLLRQRRDVSAVTGACLLTTKTLWHGVGGMDEEKLAVAFNDVDYCLKLRQMQKRIIWTPYAKLWHHESVSRGKDDTKEKLARFASEEATMHLRWGKQLRSDPYHNPNLSLVAEDFVLEAFPENLGARTSIWS